MYSDESSKHGERVLEATDLGETVSVRQRR